MINKEVLLRQEDLESQRSKVKLSLIEKKVDPAFAEFIADLHIRLVRIELGLIQLGFCQENKEQF